MISLIGTLGIGIIYIIVQLLFTIKGLSLARTLTFCIYWIIEGFWSIIVAAFFETGSYNKHYTISGLLFCTIGIICLISNFIKEYQKKKDAYARLGNYQ